MRVVLDSNILFSALISPHSYPHTIYCAWRAARFQLVTSDKRAGLLQRGHIERTRIVIASAFCEKVL